MRIVFALFVVLMLVGCGSHHSQKAKPGIYASHVRSKAYYVHK